MKPRITLLTPCVDDRERAVQFYRDGHTWAAAWNPQLAP
jgi:hypothetical protein